MFIKAYLSMEIRRKYINVKSETLMALLLEHINIDVLNSLYSLTNHVNCEEKYIYFCGTVFSKTSIYVKPFILFWIRCQH